MHSITVFSRNREGEAVFMRITRVSAGLATMVSGIILVGCVEGAAARRIVPSYDPFTRRLVQMSADQNGDGRFDQWTFLDGNRPLRGEADSDGDGRIDRWEYFDTGSVLVSVGTSSQNDGIEDTWTFAAPTRDGETRIVLSRKRDRQLDRTEFVRGAELMRTEDDTNGDGRTDRWDRYEGSVLREAAFDTTLQRGRPDRRLVYDAAGRFAAIEADPDGDGTFERLSGEAARPRGVER
jgi:hypothetical protein